MKEKDEEPVFKIIQIEFFFLILVLILLSPKKILLNLKIKKIFP